MCTDRDMYTCVYILYVCIYSSMSTCSSATCTGNLMSTPWGLNEWTHVSVIQNQGCSKQRVMAVLSMSPQWRLSLWSPPTSILKQSCRLVGSQQYIDLVSMEVAKLPVPSWLYCLGLCSNHVEAVRLGLEANKKAGVSIAWSKHGGPKRAWLALMRLLSLLCLAFASTVDLGILQ